MIRGTTELIAHIGFPTHAFKSPLIYNPYFEEAGIDAVVVPMGCRAEHFASVLRAVFTLTNTRGALITMPHKIAAAASWTRPRSAVRIAGSCNAVRRLEDGRLHGDLFDGEGFVKALTSERLPRSPAHGRSLSVRAAWVQPSPRHLAAAGVTFDRTVGHRARSLPGPGQSPRRRPYPNLELTADVDHPAADRDIVVNATPMGMNENDPLPVGHRATSNRRRGLAMS